MSRLQKAQLELGRLYKKQSKAQSGPAPEGWDYLVREQEQKVKDLLKSRQ